MLIVQKAIKALLAENVSVYFKYTSKQFLNFNKKN